MPNKVNSLNSNNIKHFDPILRQKIELKKACEEFEAILITYMLKVMRRSVPKSSLFDNGLGKEIYTSLMDEQLGREMANAEQMGIASLLYKQLIKNISERSENSSDKINRIDTKGGGL